MEKDTSWLWLMISQGTLGWNSFREKSEACNKMERLCKKLQNEEGVPIVKIKSDHGKEFENAKLEHFAMSTISKRNSQPQRLHNKMGLLKGRIG